MLSFMFYDLSFLVIFSLAVGIFLFIERKKLVRDGPMFLYKTSIGLKLINYVGRKYKKTLKVMSYVVVFCGYILMIASVYLLLQIVYMFTNPALVKAVKIPPITPLIPYLPELFKVTYLPPFYFTYWIIAIALVAIFHEGFHGIFAKFNKIRIKSSGFGFLGPFLAFFVEQDEKQMQKASPFNQMVVLAAGVFANVLLAIIFFFIMMWFFNAAYAPNGVIFNDYTYSAASISMVISNATIFNETLEIGGANLTKIKLENESYFISNDFFDLNLTEKAEDKTLVKLYQDLPAIRQQMMGAITKINNRTIKSNKDIEAELVLYKPGDKITVQTEYQNESKTVKLNYEFKLAKDYENESRAIMGIATYGPVSTSGFKSFVYKIMSYFKDPNVYYEPKANPELTIFVYNLFWWLFLINFGVALANMWPVVIFDGGRFFYLSVLLITKKKKIAEKSFKCATWIILGLFALLMVLWFIGIG